MKNECSQLKKKKYSGDKKNKYLILTSDELDNKKSSSSGDEQANIYLMVDTNENVEVKTCSESDTSSNASSDHEEEMPYDVLI